MRPPVRQHAFTLLELVIVLALLTGTLQALVFTVLSTIYFLLMLPHDHEHEHAHDDDDENA